MDLQHFISESLKQIISGVKSAQEHAIENGAKVNPKPFVCDQDRLDEETDTRIVDIAFDVAVTVTEGTENEGGLRIAGGFLDIGGGRKSDSTNTSINRIQLAIPIVLPVSKQLKE